MPFVQGLTSLPTSGISVNPSSPTSETSFKDQLLNVVSDTKAQGQGLEQTVLQQTLAGTTDVTNLTPELLELGVSFEMLNNMRDLSVSVVKRLLETPL